MFVVVIGRKLKNVEKTNEMIRSISFQVIASRPP